MNFSKKRGSRCEIYTHYHTLGQNAVERPEDWDLVRKARYYLVPIHSIIASVKLEFGDGFRFSENQEFNKLVLNSRNYSAEKEIRTNRLLAGRFHPEFLINTNPDGSSGPPVLLRTGNLRKQNKFLCVSGNRRLTLLTLRQSENKGRKYCIQNYLAYLFELMSKGMMSFYGFEAQALDKEWMSRLISRATDTDEAKKSLQHAPVLVRVMDPDEHSIQLVDKSEFISYLVHEMNFSPVRPGDDVRKSIEVIQWLLCSEGLKKEYFELLRKLFAEGGAQEKYQESLFDRSEGEYLHHLKASIIRDLEAWKELLSKAYVLDESENKLFEETTATLNSPAVGFISNLVIGYFAVRLAKLPGSTDFGAADRLLIYLNSDNGKAYRKALLFGIKRIVKKDEEFSDRSSPEAFWNAGTYVFIKNQLSEKDESEGRQFAELADDSDSDDLRGSDEDNSFWEGIFKSRKKEPKGTKRKIHLSGLLESYFKNKERASIWGIRDRLKTFRFGASATDKIFHDLLIEYIDQRGQWIFPEPTDKKSKTSDIRFAFSLAKKKQKEIVVRNLSEEFLKKVDIEYQDFRVRLSHSPRTERSQISQLVKDVEVDPFDLAFLIVTDKAKPFAWLRNNLRSKNRTILELREGTSHPEQRDRIRNLGDQIKKRIEMHRLGGS